MRRCTPRLGLALGIALLSVSFAHAVVEATTYYVSDTRGDDNNTGDDPARPWKTLARVNEAFIEDPYLCDCTEPEGNTLGPGDRILMRRGDEWRGQLNLQFAFGEEDDPIVIGAYGEASLPKPIIRGSDHEFDWYLGTEEYGAWTTLGCGLEVGKVYQDTTLLVRARPDTAGRGSWWRTGGCLWVRTTDDSPPAANDITVFRAWAVKVHCGNHVIIEDLHTKDTSGIDVGSRVWWCPVGDIDAVTIRNCRIGDTAPGGGGIVLRHAGHGADPLQGPTNIIERNSITGTGNVAIHLFFTDNTLVRDNVISDIGLPVVLGRYRNDEGDRTGISLQAGVPDSGSGDCRAPEDWSCQSIIVEGNRLHRIWGVGIDFHLTEASIIRYNFIHTANGMLGPDGTDLFVYGNIVHVNWYPGTEWGKGLSQGHVGAGNRCDDGIIAIFNNTFSGFYNGRRMIRSLLRGRVVWRNNVFYQAEGGRWLAFDCSSTCDDRTPCEFSTEPNLDELCFVDVDYNAYYQAGGEEGQYRLRSFDTVLGCEVEDCWVHSFDEYQSSLCVDEGNSMAQNPEIVAPGGLGPYSYQLLAHSPCINAGQDTLAFLQDLCKNPDCTELPDCDVRRYIKFEDYFGNPVPHSGRPDIGAIEFTGLVSASTTAPPRDRYGIRLVHPNPFNPSATVIFALPYRDRVTIDVYDLAGRLIRRLASETLEKGEYRTTWQGKDEQGMDVASGVYYLRMEVGDLRDTRRITLVR